MHMTVAAYIRVSTRRQNDDGQRAEVKKWLDNNGIDPMKVEWYCDKESGTTLKRPEFDRLQADIFHGRVKTVVLWKLDRLSRRLKDGITPLAE
jgi:DNA invertase Pin-like site-specific DNA recombinase